MKASDSLLLGASIVQPVPRTGSGRLAALVLIWNFLLHLSRVCPGKSELGVTSVFYCFLAFSCSQGASSLFVPYTICDKYGV